MIIYIEYMFLKLKDLTCSVIKLDTNDQAYDDHTVKLEDSPWVIYLQDNNTVPLYNSFYATRKHPYHKDDYWYDVTKFDTLVESIKKLGYKNSLCNNKVFQDNFNGNDWQGGRGAIKMSFSGKIGDGHHRCAVLYYLYGPEYEINILPNCLIDDIPPL